jgi:hypothetical protein
MNMPIRTALFAASLLVPLAVGAGTASAQQTDGTRVIRVSAGATVLIVQSAPQSFAPATVRAAPGVPGWVSRWSSPGVSAGAIPDASPVMHLIARQEAMTDRMMARMDEMFAGLPDPNALIQATLRDLGGPMAPNVITTSAQPGHGFRSQSVTYVYAGDGQAPRISVTRSGDACGEDGAPGAEAVMQTPEQAPARPAAQTYDIGYPAHPVPVHRTPRT